MIAFAGYLVTVPAAAALATGMFCPPRRTFRLRARSASGDARPARYPRNGVLLGDQPRRHPDAPRGEHPYPETEAAS